MVLVYLWQLEQHSMLYNNPNLNEEKHGKPWWQVNTRTPISLDNKMYYNIIYIVFISIIWTPFRQNSSKNTQEIRGKKREWRRRRRGRSTAWGNRSEEEEQKRKEEEKHECRSQALRSQGTVAMNEVGREEKGCQAKYRVVQKKSFIKYSWL